MMNIEPFYYGTIKSIIAAFGIVFSNVKYMNDFDEIIRVPIHFASKEKFIEAINANTEYDTGLDVDYTLPRFGFELLSIDFDPSRMSNPLSRMREANDEKNIYMLNRIPYNFSFTLYLATRKVEDSLKIVEQIVPFFTPELNITIKDKPDFGYLTDIPILLSNMSYNIDNQGAFDSQRTVMWQFNFMVKGFLYSNTREQTRIKETILKLEQADFNKVYETLTSSVEPRSAEKTQPHTIIDRVFNGLPPVKFSFDFSAGSLCSLNSEKDTKFTVLTFKPIRTGNELNLIEF